MADKDNDGGQCRVVQSTRQIIEHKLLAALDDDEKVAIIASRTDLALLIAGLDKLTDARAGVLSQDMQQLQREAFGS